MTAPPEVWWWIVVLSSGLKLAETLNCNKQYTYFESYSLNGFNVTCNGITKGYEHVLRTVTVYNEISLTVTNSTLENVTSGLFKRVSNVKTLAIVNSQLSIQKDVDVFGYLKHLECLEIKNTKISIGNVTLSTLRMLRRLELANNSLEVVDGALDDLQGLEELSITDNLISDLRRFHLNQFTKLKSLNLHGNAITSLAGLHGSSSLVDLDLSANLVADVGDLIRNLTTLRYLNLNHNRLEVIKLYSNELETLIASHNVISRVEREAYNNNLRTLDLSFNKLEDFSLSNDEGLEILNLEHNDLKTITLEAVTHLRVLNLASNQLTNLPRKLPSLEDLTLSDNSLTKLPDDLFSGLTKLISLDLSRNDLTSIDKYVVADLINLEVLNVSSNRLEYLPYSLLQPLVNLDVLDVSNNRIKHFDYPQVMASALTTLYVKNNPLTCDVVSEIVAFAETRNVSFTVNQNSNYACVGTPNAWLNVGVGLGVSGVVIVAFVTYRCYVYAKRGRRSEEFELIDEV